MAIGFRKSLFGFNSDDVMSYIESTHKNFSEKETELNEKIEELNSRVDELQTDFVAVSGEKESIERQLKEYTDRYDEITRLSENIGKLYLVAQANAQAIMKNSEENCQMSGVETRKNLATLEEAHTALEEMKQKILKSTNSFAADVDNLIASLSDTKQQIEQNNLLNEQHSADFESVYKLLAK